MSFQSTSFSEFIAPLNQALEPMVKLGVGAPLNFSPGLVVLEVPGRVSGKVRTIPLMAYAAYPYVAVGTVRENSQWIKNLHAADHPKLWVWGQRFNFDRVNSADQWFIGRLSR